MALCLKSRENYGAQESYTFQGKNVEGPNGEVKLNIYPSKDIIGVSNKSNGGVDSFDINGTELGGYRIILEKKGNQPQIDTNLVGEAKETLSGKKVSTSEAAKKSA